MKSILPLLLSLVTIVNAANSTIFIAVVLYDDSPTIILPDDYTSSDPTQQTLCMGIKLWYSKINNLGGIPIYSKGNTSYIRPIIKYFSVGNDISSISIKLPQLLGYYLTAAGPFGPQGFKYIIPPAGNLATYFMQYCETGNCLVVSPLTSSIAQTVCLDQLTHECSNKRIGSRRFDYTFQVLPDYSYSAQEFLNWGQINGIKSVSIYYASSEFATNALGYTINVATSLRMKVIESISFTNNSIDDVLIQTRSNNPDSIIVLADLGSVPMCISIIKSLKVINWLPKAIVFVGGCLQLLSNDTIINQYQLHKYMFGILPWDQRIKGSDYNTVNSIDNLELWPSDLQNDSPQIFSNSAIQFYGSLSPAQLVLIALGAQTCTIIQKGIEQSSSSNPTVAQLRSSTNNLFQPSIYGRLAFDLKGRLVSVMQYVVQMTDDNQYVLITPPSVAVSPVFPIPTFDERIFINSSYNTNVELAILLMTIIAISISLIILIIVVINRDEPTIRASTFSFCILILLGAIMMQTSTLLWSFNGSTDKQCQGFAWLLFLGAGLMFQSLFIKTFRLWKIFITSELKVVKFTVFDLFKYLSIFVVFDIVYLTIWTIVDPIKSRLYSPDVHRLALNYYTCTTGDSGIGTNLAIGLLVVKLAIMIFGCFISISVRNIPENFNESHYIGISLYCSAFTLLIGLPIVLLNIGSREFNYIIRTSMVILISFSVMIPLFIPKFSTIYNPTTVNSLSNSDNYVVKMADTKSRERKIAFERTGTPFNNKSGHSPVTKSNIQTVK